MVRSFFFFLLIKVFSIYMHDKEKKRNVVQYYDLCIEWYIYLNNLDNKQSNHLSIYIKIVDTISYHIDGIIV